MCFRISTLLLGLLPRSGVCSMAGYKRMKRAENCTVSHNEAALHPVASFADATLHIDRLFANSHCNDVYLDVGTNIGVQIRKLLEPHLYPKASSLRFFEDAYGPPPRYSVCAIGFEPNPYHNQRLNQLQTELNQVGFSVLILPVGAGVSQGRLTFKKLQPTNWGCDALGISFAATSTSVQNQKGSLTTAPVLSFADVLDHIIRRRSSGRRAVVAMKLDPEGAEDGIVHALLDRNLMCGVHSLYVEFHDKTTGLSAEKRRSIAHAKLRLEQYVLTIKRNESARAAGCLATTMATTDDESYQLDGNPWPSQQGKSDGL